jgi:hypothetical protein
MVNSCLLRQESVIEAESIRLLLQEWSQNIDEALGGLDVWGARSLAARLIRPAQVRSLGRARSRSNGLGAQLGPSQIAWITERSDGGLGLGYCSSFGAHCVSQDIDSIDLVIEERASAKSLDRPGLKRALDLLTSGDTTALHFHHATQDRDGIERLLGADEGNPH